MRKIRTTTHFIVIISVMLFFVLHTCESSITEADGQVELTIRLENDLGFAVAADIEVRNDGDRIQTTHGSSVTFTLDRATYDIIAARDGQTQTASVSLENTTEITLTFSTDQLNPDLRAHYNFEGGLADITGQFDAGTIVGNRINNGSGGSVSYDKGQWGQAAVFDGASGIRLPDGLISDNSYSVSIGVNPDQITDFTTTFFGGFAEGAVQSWISLVPRGPTGETMLWSGNDPWYDATTSLTIDTGEWTHLACTVDNGEVKVYINGNERFSGTGFPDVFTGIESVFALGVNYWDPPFRGKMDELRIYDKALSPTELTSLAEGYPDTGGDGGQGPAFRNVSVHDPMVARDGDAWYVFGSHLASARSDNLIQWEQMSTDWDPDNPIIPNPEEELQEALAWPEPDAESTWAVSVIELNGQYYMYFSSAHWDSPRSTIALAVADEIDGPYEYQEMLIKKYRNGEYSEEAGEPYDDSVHPGVIDPHVFFDANNNLWMVYGSYAGGIHILEMDPESGYPKPEQGYGKRIAGGNHGPMEAPYILYHPGTGYYYLFLSFGTLASDGGYNIRVARSENPDGPYVDPNGNNMLDAKGPDWDNVEPYGAKLIGNFEFRESEIGYLSPGHNSAYYDESREEMYIFFHTRFPGRGELHQVRVHQLMMNSEGWPVMAPHRYGGETAEEYVPDEVAGTYQYISHGRDIQATFGTPGGDINESRHLELKEDGSISGAVSGTWSLTGNYRVDITLDGTVYHGVFLEQWDPGLEAYVMTFSALSSDNVAIWGSKL